MAPKSTLLVGLVGQQNAGKSTIFNMLTGANQQIANYPGVTVDKKTGSYRSGNYRVQVVDLPGTYSLTSFSLEERVARDFLLNERPDVVVNVMDASQLRRSLYLTFQLMEMGLPIVLACNMMDIAESEGQKVDVACLAETLVLSAVATVGRKGHGKAELRNAIDAVAKNKLSGAAGPKQPIITYDDMEAHIKALEERLHDTPALAWAAPLRWLAVKLLEGDQEAFRILDATHPAAAQVRALVEKMATAFEEENGLAPADYIVICRDRLAAKVVRACLTQKQQKGISLSEKIDRVVLNRVLAPLVLLLSIYLIYEISIVQGYKLTEYTWPLLAWLREIVALLLPAPGLLEDPLLRSLILWMVDSANTLLNYVPIFFILFMLIAALEDSGYMARIAFILDRIFHSFGLHGQSTLPFILAGVFAGGCAVPGIMATKGIPDERSRLATILTVPYMNCLAKAPLYILLINIYFAAHKSWVLFFVSTITIIIALIVAKFLTTFVLRGKEIAPFVMEMPTYHLPTVKGVLQRAYDRTWQYIKKVGTIVVAVSICVFILLQFPGISDESMKNYDARMEKAMAEFRAQAAKLGDTPYRKQWQGGNLDKLVVLYNEYRAAKLTAGPGGSKSVNERFKENYPLAYPLIARSKDKVARKINKLLRGLSQTRKTIRREIRSEKIRNSFFGRVGRAMEPFTRFAGFDWKVNIALISSFAARESSVATLGALFQEKADEGATLEKRMQAEGTSEGRTPLGALAIIIFFALYPPCLATTIMVKVQTASYKWMLFSIIFPTLLGLAAASAVYTLGGMMGLTGVQAMVGFYVVALLLAIGLAFMPDPVLKTPHPTYVRPG
ncbi:MAG: ferrous iron transport protein B [Desulfarculaceae bacterium]|jgi:ferrous iron transport protein B